MNTAGRLLTIHDEIFKAARPDNTPMVKVWASAFDLDAHDPHLEDHAVLCLQAMRSEINLFRSKLLEMAIPEALFKVGFNSLRNVTSPTLLTTHWNQHKTDLSRPEVRMTLQWGQWALRDESEEDLPADEIAALKDELEALETSLNQAEMGVFLREFIQRQIDTIRAALRVYRVQGVKPIKEAIRNVAGDVAVEGGVVTAEWSKESIEGRSLFAKVGETIERVAKRADQLNKVYEFGENATKIGTTVLPLLLTLANSVK